MTYPPFKHFTLMEQTPTTNDLHQIASFHSVVKNYCKMKKIEAMTPCPNCKETVEQCACMRNKCMKCGGPVGNITFTVCDDCWDKEHGTPSEPTTASDSAAAKEPEYWYNWDDSGWFVIYKGDIIFMNPLEGRAGSQLEEEISAAVKALNAQTEVSSLQAEVAALKEENERLRDALEELVSYQNGPPLVTYTDGWNKAMEKAYALLSPDKTA